MRKSILGVAVVALAGLAAASVGAQDLGPVGESPYEVVAGWLKPFEVEQGFTFGGNVGVHADTPDRVFIVQRGSTRLPNPIPPGFDGFAPSIGMSTQKGEGRVWRNVILVVNRDGQVVEGWSQWDHLFARNDAFGVHRIRISPYDPERRVWVIDESSHQIHVFSNDGKRHIMTLGERDVPGSDGTHFNRPQDVAFLRDGRFLVGDGLGNRRVAVFDAQGKYLTEFGKEGKGAPGLLASVHGVTVGPDGTIFVVDRDGRSVHLFREQGGSFVPVAMWTGFETPLDIVTDGTHVWLSDLGKPKVIKMDMQGNRLYTWFWPTEGPGGFREMHTIGIDSEGNIYGADNQFGRTLKFRPRPGANPDLLIKKRW